MRRILITATDTSQLFFLGPVAITTDIQVYVNGLVQTAVQDYLVLGQYLRLNVAPTVEDTVAVYLVAGGTHWIDLTGSVNNVNKVFALSPVIVTSTSQVFLNGVLLTTAEYTISNSSLTMNVAPQDGDILTVYSEVAI